MVHFILSFTFIILKKITDTVFYFLFIFTTTMRQKYKIIQHMYKHIFVILDCFQTVLIPFKSLLDIHWPIWFFFLEALKAIFWLSWLLGTILLFQIKFMGTGEMVQRGKALATHKSGRTDFIKLSADLYIYVVTYMCIHTHALYIYIIKN